VQARSIVCFSYRGYRLTGQYPNGGAAIDGLYGETVPRVARSEQPARRRRLIDAAWRCLARGSYADLRVEDVCAEAGLSKGSFYGYFRSKQELFYSLMDEDSRLLEEAAVGASALGLPAASRLLRFAGASLRAAEDPARVQLRADIWAAATSDTALAERLREANARRRAILRDWIEQAVDAGSLADIPANALAAMMLALVDGLAFQRRLDPGSFRTENIQRALEVLITSLADSASAAALDDLAA
jgi:AcrR family transcriptional regulator